jgi:hypothetical protein
MRRLGFTNEDVAVGVCRGTAFGAIAQVVRFELNVQDKEFGYHAGIWNESEEAFLKIWKKFIECLEDHTIPDSLLQEWFDKYHGEFSDLVHILLSKGIDPPLFSDLINKPAPEGSKPS